MKQNRTIEKMEAPVMMIKEYWLASQLSVAKYAGGCKAFGHEYLVMPQTFDLLRTDFIPFYTKLGRDKFMKTLRFYAHADDKELKQHMKNLIAEQRGAKSGKAPKEGELF